MVGEAERLSIPVSIGNSGVTVNYLFDTGSSPFISAYTQGAPWWGSQFTPAGQTRTLHYAVTGCEITPVQTQIAVGSSGHSMTSAPSFPANQAVVRLLKRGGGWIQDPKWQQSLQAAVQSGIPPEQGGHFYGTMGADLANPDVGLSRLVHDATAGSGGRVLPGFSIQGVGGDPSLTLGLTPALESRFPIRLPIDKVGGKFAQKVITADYSLEYRGRTYPLGKAGTILDTGAPRAGINTAVGFEVPPALRFGRLLRRGVVLHMQCGSLSWTLVAGPGHRIGITQASGPQGGVNAGIHFYESFDVMFDLQNGIIGFAPRG